MTIPIVLLTLVLKALGAMGALAYSHAAKETCDVHSYYDSIDIKVAHMSVGRYLSWPSKEACFAACCSDEDCGGVKLFWREGQTPLCQTFSCEAAPAEGTCKTLVVKTSTFLVRRFEKFEENVTSWDEMKEEGNDTTESPFQRPSGLDEEMLGKLELAHMAQHRYNLRPGVFWGLVGALVVLSCWSGALVTVYLLERRRRTFCVRCNRVSRGVSGSEMGNLEAAWRAAARERADSVPRLSSVPRKMASHDHSTSPVSAASFSTTSTGPDC